MTRSQHQEFISSGFASRKEALRTGEYYSAEEVLAELDQMLLELLEKPSDIQSFT